MANGTNVDKTTLNQWIQNFRTNTDLPFTTNAAAVSLGQLENYIQDVKTNTPGLNGFRIYMIRFPFNDNAPDSDDLEKAGRNISQPSLVLVPIENYDQSTGSGEDLERANTNDVFVLAFSDPQNTDPGDTTTLCPPKCG